MIGKEDTIVVCERLLEKMNKVKMNKPDDYLMTCKYCGNLRDCIEDANKCSHEHNPDFEGEKNCSHFKRATRADKIRSMSDNELAEWLARTQISIVADVMALVLPQEEYKASNEVIENTMIEAREWLLEPYTDGED